tara:strand:+ start:27978 stop:28949 length:972 start_codon:yes stop_codon:yes gene_type:complete
MNYENEKYLTTPENLKDTIDLYGVGIIPNVLNESEIKDMQNGAWDYFEHITQVFETPISRNNEDSWKGFFSLYPKHSMLHQHFKIGHSQYIWDIRQNEKVVNIFSKFWNVDNNELFTSFDGASFHLPPETTNRGWFRNPWYHCDQSFKRNDFECIQSWITAYDIDDGDGTLSFYEGSNKYHKDFYDNHDTVFKGEWYKLADDNEREFYTIEKQCEIKNIKCKAGSMVFWDSRTIHCGIEPQKGRDVPKIRNVVYLCMTPKSFSTAKTNIKRIKAFNNLRMTSHTPHRCLLFPKKPRTYGGPIPEVASIDKPTLTLIGQSLVGI